MPALKKEDGIKYEKSRRQLEELEDRFHDRITEILQLVAKYFKGEHGTWYYPNAAEGEMGTTSADFANEDDTIDFEWLGKNLTNAYDYMCNAMPVEWLYKPDGAILKEIDDEIEQAKREKERKESNRKKAKEKRQALQTSAMKKLTSEEKKALGLAPAKKQARRKRAKRVR